MHDFAVNVSKDLESNLDEHDGPIAQRMHLCVCVGGVRERITLKEKKM